MVAFRYRIFLLVFHSTSHSFATLTRELFSETLEECLTRTHVLFSIYQTYLSCEGRGRQHNESLRQHGKISVFYHVHDAFQFERKQYIYNSGTRSAQRSPIIIPNSSDSSNRKKFGLDTVRATGARCYFQYARLTALQALSQPLRNGMAKEKVIRRRDCVRNKDTPLVCARRHREITMKCAYSSAEPQCSVRRAHSQALHEGFTWAR